MLWVLLPAYDEEDDLPKLLPKLDQVLRGNGLDYRIVVVDDGSQDATASLLEDYQSRYSMEIVTHPLNRGLGETERDGFEYVAFKGHPDDVVVRLDCDDTHDPKYIPSMIQKLKSGYDVVGASRFQPGGVQTGLTRYRALISLAANWFMRAVFYIPGVRDYSCGYRIYRCRVIQDAIRLYGNNFIQLKGLGFTSTLEIVVKLYMLGCRFAEVPFVLRYDQKLGYSKMVSSVTALGYFVMAVLYHWPVGGWGRYYRGLAGLYRKDPDVALEMFCRRGSVRQAGSEVSE